MMLTDREWLRFVSFAIVVGAALGATATGALFLTGRPPAMAIGAGVAWAGLLAAAFHLLTRRLLDRASEPPTEQPTEGTA